MSAEPFSPPAAMDLPLLPARMVNAFVFCPRLAYLEWINQEWADNADTIEGRLIHQRTETLQGKLPEPAVVAEGGELVARSVTLASAALGVIATIDLIEGEDGVVRPVDYKRGRRPHVPQSAFLPERVQIALHILILREHGYRCEEGVLYFAGSRERVVVKLDEELQRQTEAAVEGLRRLAVAATIPPPLEDSPQCARCSLVGICLPDEVAWLRGGQSTPRPLAARRQDALPLIVQDGRARIVKEGETLRVTVDGEVVAVARIAEVSQVVVFGHVAISTPALHELMRREIPVCWHSYGGWFLGHTAGLGHRNVELRAAQWRRCFDPGFCLQMARGLVAAKIRNGRTLLRRNWRGAGPPTALLGRLDRDRRDAEAAPDRETLLGLEGVAARRYFEGFANCLAAPWVGEGGVVWEGRQRRPPTDPLNAALSFAYAMLVRAWTVQISAVGLDPYCGFYHRPRFGRPALALDMMEPFRPLVADSAVLTAINNGEVSEEDFLRRGGAVALTPRGRKAIITAFERRLDHEITHPLFGYRISYRRLFEVQARLLGRFLTGEIPDLPHLTPR